MVIKHKAESIDILQSSLQAGFLTKQLPIFVENTLESIYLQKLRPIAVFRKKSKELL